MKEFKEFVSVIVGLIIGAAVMALALFVWQRSGGGKDRGCCADPPAVNAHDRIDGREELGSIAGAQSDGLRKLEALTKRLGATDVQGEISQFWARLARRFEFWKCRARLGDVRAVMCHHPNLENSNLREGKSCSRTSAGSNSVRRWPSRHGRETRLWKRFAKNWARKEWLNTAEGVHKTRVFLQDISNIAHGSKMSGFGLPQWRKEFRNPQKTRILRLFERLKEAADQQRLLPYQEEASHVPLFSPRDGRTVLVLRELLGSKSTSPFQGVLFDAVQGTIKDGVPVDYSGRFRASTGANQGGKRPRL